MRARALRLPRNNTGVLLAWQNDGIAGIQRVHWPALPEAQIETGGWEVAHDVHNAWWPGVPQTSRSRMHMRIRFMYYCGVDANEANVH